MFSHCSGCEPIRVSAQTNYPPIDGSHYHVRTRDRQNHLFTGHGGEEQHDRAALLKVCWRVAPTLGGVRRLFLSVLSVGRGLQGKGGFDTPHRRVHISALCHSLPASEKQKPRIAL